MKQALAIISFFKYTELIRHSSCSHPFDQWPFFYYKRAVAGMHSFKFTVFSDQEELQQEDIIVINYNTSLVSGKYILKDSMIFDNINSSHPFFLLLSLFQGALEAIHYPKGTVFISQYLLQSPIITSGLQLILRKAVVVLLC